MRRRIREAAIPLLALAWGAAYITLILTLLLEGKP